MRFYLRFSAVVLALVLPGLALAALPTLTITTDSQLKVYGGALPALTVSYSGFQNGDTAASLTTQPSISVGASAGSPVGNYNISANGAVDPNYTIQYVNSGQLTITPAPLTITADNQSKVYGSALPTLTASYTGFVIGDTAASLATPPTITTTATNASHVVGSPYAIAPSGAVDSNYTISYISGNLSVSPAPLTIVANNQSKFYGSAIPTLTATYSGLVNGDTAASLISSPTLSTTATAASHVAGNPYAITASGAFDPDYSISYVPGILIVSSAPLTITADNQTKVYGAALPALTASYTGFVSGDTAASLVVPPTLTTTATVASHVAGNPYAITASGAFDPDYSINYVPGNLTVTPAPLTITAGNQTKVYGAALPTLTSSYTGFVNGDSAASLSVPPTLTTTATAASHVAGSPYAINASGAVDPDYTISYVPGNLSVTPAALTITADNHAKLYGAALPTLTATYSGLVNSDSAASFITPPTLSTTATSGSAVGNYPITASGAVDPDYTVSYVGGSLTINPSPLTITADDQTRAFGQPDPAFTVSYSGFVNSDFSGSLTTQPTVASGATATSPAGTYTLTPSGAVDGNYTISYVAGTLTITAEAQTTTFSSTPPTEVAGATIPYTVSASATSGLTVTFSIDPVSTPGTCSISGTTVSFMAAGTCIVDADQAGNASFSPAPTVQQTVVVAAATARPIAPLPMSPWALLLLGAVLLGFAGNKTMRN